MSKVQPTEGEDAATAATKNAARCPPSPYVLNQIQLNDLSSNKDNDELKRLGGVDGLAGALGSSTSVGLDPEATGDGSLAAHAAAFGQNVLPEKEAESFFSLVWGNLQDPVVQLLCAAALVSTVLGAALPDQRAKNEWIEGVAIWVAVLLVTCVGAGNDYNKEKQFRKLNSQKDEIRVKVVRAGKQVLVLNTEIVVGDVLMLDTGDKVVADGIVIHSFGLVVDEASLTGESDPIKKDRDEDPWVRSGTQIVEGSGQILVVAVGINSEWGKTLELVEEAGDDETPLQSKLEDVAAAIGKIGFGVAIACFIALIIKWCIEHHGFPIKQINNNGPVQFFLYAVTIIVVAVPEGLPLAVTISLAYSMKKMMNDNNFVRVLAACETMGGATAICSDKTGTLTENRMTVVEGWFSGTALDHAPTTSELRPELLELLKLNAALNSKAFLVDNEGKPTEFVGNRTECALLMMLRGWNCDYAAIRHTWEDRLERMFGFTSARKMASCVVRMDDRYRLFNKGAAEWVLRQCNTFYNEYGDVVELTEEARNVMQDTIVGMAKRGLRCLCLTYTDFPLNDANRPDDFFDNVENLDQNLTVLAIVGIKDPVRKEVPAAVRTCQKAGIVVRMVTGDNIYTAKHIATECGILAEGDIAMEGPTFRAMPANDLLPLLPKLRVLARSSPEDKLTLVSMLKKQGEVVAVTGDGTNDAPALKESDVGLAMGIAGTEVAKEAADIVILDDNFSSIVKSVLWGRSVFNNIRKFLQFQLTVNAVALVICFIGAIVGGHEPLNVLQLLWVNLIMDTMGALALATELPNIELLDQPPNGREEPLISKKMWKHISIQALYQLFWMLLCLYGLPVLLPRYQITADTDYYHDNCINKVADHLGISTGIQEPTSIYNPQTAGSAWYCSLMTQCGWPLGTGRDVTGCAVLNQYYSFTPPAFGTYPKPTVPDNPYLALCSPFYGSPGMTNSTILSGADQPDCPLYNSFDSARGMMAADFADQQNDDWKKPLSVLFNAFIMMQVANEINARRINDEYNVFEGLTKSPIFMGVIVITMGLQAIIMNFLGMFFVVVPLDWKEWLATMAIGVGSWPVSFITRFVSKQIDAHLKRKAAEEAAKPVLTKVGSGRGSFRTNSGGTGSMRGQTRLGIMARHG